MIDTPVKTLVDAIEMCKQINQTGNTNASFKLAVPQKIDGGTHRYFELIFIQSVDGWVMRQNWGAGV